MADYKAVSMNLMHEDIRVTDGIYAPLAGNDIQQRIAGLTNQAATVPQASDSLTALIQSLPKEQLTAALITIAQQMSK